MRIKAVLFDFDGTLTEPGTLDYSAIRDAIGCSQGSPILECIARMRSRARRAKALRILTRSNGRPRVSPAPMPARKNCSDCFFRVI